MVTISESSRQTPYQPTTPTNAFPVGFPIFDNDDLQVLANGKVITAYTVTATYVGGVSTDAVVNITGAGITGDVLIKGNRIPRRTDQYRNGAPLKIDDHNYSLNRIEVTMQELRRDTNDNSEVLDGFTDDVQRAVEAAQSAEESAQRAEDAAEAAESAAGSLWSNFASRAAVESANVPALVSYIRTAGYYSAGDGGGALYKRVASEPIHAGKVTSADGAWWELAENVINIKTLGAKADSSGSGTGTDNSTVLANAISCAVSLKKNVYIPAGDYRLASQVVYDKSALNADNTAVPSIVGDGVTTTRFHCDAGGIRLIGSLAAGFYVSWIQIKDIQFMGNHRATSTVGIDVENQGFLRFERVKCSNFDTGIRLKGVISSKIEQPYLSYNRIGLHALPDDGDLWPPNALTIDQPWIGSNTRAGIILDKPATFNIRGGSVEGNGTDTTISVNQRGGIFVNLPGLGGHAAIISDGVYYEYNSGVADVLFFGTSRAVASAFSGNTFTRMGANPTNSCIAVYSATHKFSMSLDGNGFGELGSGATPTGPYIDIESNPLVKVSESGNTYQNATYAPDFSGVMADCEQTRPIAMGYISAAGAVEGHSVNVASVTKIAAGQYKINLASPVAGRKFALTQPGSARVTYNLSFDATSVTVGFTNLAGVDTDTEFGFVAYATEKR